MIAYAFVICFQLLKRDSVGFIYFFVLSQLLRKGKGDKGKEFGSKIKEKCVERLWVGIYRM